MTCFVAFFTAYKNLVGLSENELFYIVGNKITYNFMSLKSYLTDFVNCKINVERKKTN